MTMTRLKKEAIDQFMKPIAASFPEGYCDGLDMTPLETLTTKQIIKITPMIHQLLTTFFNGGLQSLAVAEKAHEKLINPTIEVVWWDLEVRPTSRTLIKVVERFVKMDEAVLYACSKPASEDARVFVNGEALSATQLANTLIAYDTIRIGDEEWLNIH